MRKLSLIVMMLLVITWLCAAEGLDHRSVYHFAGSAFLYSASYCIISTNFDMHPSTNHEFSTIITSSICVGKEVYDWNQGASETSIFWDLAIDFVGIGVAAKFWEGSEPRIYPIINSKYVGIKARY